MIDTIKQVSKKKVKVVHISIIIILISAMFTGCKGENGDLETDDTRIELTPTIEVSSSIKDTDTMLPDQSSDKDENKTTPSIEEVDYADYFDGMEGCVVLFNPDTNVYQVYNKELSEKSSSPCSTFKIISTIMGLESGIITSVDSTMNYDGTIYGLDTWNKDVSLMEAFQSSCIWYFRKVIDRIGMTEVKAYLDDLQYGNCDISKWQGSGLNPLPELNGFWLESTLEITAMEQVGVLSDIFEGKTNFSKENIAILKEVMLVQDNDDITIYGKTGTGQTVNNGNQNNGWFVGMFESIENRFYYAIHLVDEKQEVSGAVAKSIALEIIDQYDENGISNN